MGNLIQDAQQPEVPSDPQMFHGVEDSTRNSSENADFDESNMDVEEPECDPNSYQDHLDDLSAESDDDDDILLLSDGNNKENLSSNRCATTCDVTNQPIISVQGASLPDDGQPPSPKASCLESSRCDERTSRSATTSVCSSTGSM